MRLTFYPMVNMVIATITHVLLCLLFVKKYDMGIIGLAIAHSIKDCVLLFLTVVYSWNSEKVKNAFAPLDIETFRGWYEYLRIAINAMVMLCSEEWAFEINSILAGILGVVELAAMTVVCSFTSLLFMVALGIQESTCALIGNCIGANNVPLAKRFYNMISKFTITLVCILSFVTFLTSGKIAQLFTQD